MKEIIPLKKFNVNSFRAYQAIYIMNVIKCTGFVAKPMITRTRACRNNNFMSACPC